MKSKKILKHPVGKNECKRHGAATGIHTKESQNEGQAGQLTPSPTPLHSSGSPVTTRRQT